MRNLYLAIQVAKAEILMYYIRYPMRGMVFFIAPIIWMLPFIYFGRALMGNSTSEHFIELTGTYDYISYVILGSIIVNFSTRLFMEMGFSIRHESWRGTFETVFSVPLSRFTFMSGKLFGGIAYSTLFAITLLVLSWVMFQKTYHFNRVPEAILIFILVITSIYGIGLIVAGIMLVFKEAHSTLWFLDMIIVLITPMAYPLAVLPSVLQKVSLLLPMTRATLAIRNLLLLDQPLISQWDHILVLSLYTVFFIPVGWKTYRLMEHRALKKGVVGHY